jgi:hypothetical protein
MSIILTSADIPKDLPGELDLRQRGFALVRLTDLIALEEAKARYELAHAKTFATPTPRAQQASGPVAQHTELSAPCPRLGDLDEQHSAQRDSAPVAQKTDEPSDTDLTLERILALETAANHLQSEVFRLIKHITTHRPANLGAGR